MSATIPDKLILKEFINASFYEANVVNSKLSKFVIGKDKVNQYIKYYLKIRFPDQKQGIEFDHSTKNNARIEINDIFPNIPTTQSNAIFKLLVCRWIFSN